MRFEEMMLRNGIEAINIPAINIAFGPIKLPTKELNESKKEVQNKQTQIKIDHKLILVSTDFNDNSHLPTIIKRQ